MEETGIRQQPVEALSFEEAMQELEMLTNQLASGGMSLRACVESYERGVALVRRCRDELKSARQKIDDIKELQPEQEEPLPENVPF